MDLKRAAVTLEEDPYQQETALDGDVVMKSGSNKRPDSEECNFEPSAFVLERRNVSRDD